MSFSVSGFPFTETVVAQPRDYPEWHKGRNCYAIWMVPIDCPQVLGYMAGVTDQLADLLHPTRRQPHLTVFVCGFEQPSQVQDDDFTAVQLQRQMEAMHGLQQSICTLQVGRPDSFSSAAYLSVTDPDGHLDVWRSALAEGGSEIRFGPYVPHITLGLYCQQLGVAALRERLDRVADPPELHMPVDRLEYAHYSSTDMFGPLSCQQVIYFQSGKPYSGKSAGLWQQ